MNYRTTAAVMGLYNTLTGKVEPFTAGGDEVSLYVCGITPYDTTHLGHVFTYAAVDCLVRHLRYSGLGVRYVQNLTDIDDPILRRSREEKKDWRRLGLEWTARFIEDMKRLNISPPDRYPRATDVIGDIVEETSRLIAAGAAYESGGAVYFDFSSCGAFGSLSGLNRDEMLSVAAERGNDPDDPRKRDPLDFPLWVAARENEPSWESPWGPGRPGWHIECSTMARRYLGGTIDIHGGGADLAFPHHESEIAQHECAAAERLPFARFWFHTAMVRYRGEKISKSRGNLVMLDDILRHASPDGLRLYLASHHYRQGWEYREEDLRQAEEKVSFLRTAVAAGGDGPVPGEKEVRQSFLQAMADDLDTPAAVEVLLRLGLRKSAAPLLRELGGVLGLRLGPGGPEEKVAAGWKRHRARLGLGKKKERAAD